MRKRLGSFIVVNRSSLLLIGIMSCLSVFGLIVWSAGAASRVTTAAPEPAEQVAPIATADRRGTDDPLVPANFDCSKIRELGIDRMENFRAGAIMIHCGLAEGGTPMEGMEGEVYGGADIDLITGAETSPNVVQSETFTLANPENPLHIVSAYNDSRGRNASPINISGASVSTDGGVTFTRLTAATGQSPFANTAGDPVILYHSPTDRWITVWLGGAGGALVSYRSTTPWDPSPASWTPGPSIGTGSQDRESGWSDTNPASPFFGNLYVSSNNFSVGSGRIELFRSTDGGATWSAAVGVTSTFIRNVQIRAIQQQVRFTLPAWTKWAVDLGTAPTGSTGRPTAAPPGP